MKTDIFQYCGYCWVFQICWHFECSTFTASSVRIWNSSAGVPSPPLAVIVVMLPQAHLTSHFTMSGSRRVTAPSRLFQLLRPFFFYSSSAYSCRLFLISSASITVSALYRAHPCMQCFLDISNFPEKISSLSHSIVFLYFFALFFEEGLLMSPCYSLELCIYIL